MPITYYQQSSDRATGVHVADQEDALELTVPGSTTTETVTVAAVSYAQAFAFTTPANEPNSADWPIGTFRCQLDVTAAGADLTYALGNGGTALGHFARVNAGLTADLGTWPQAEGSFSGTGLKLATQDNDQAAGDASDRFECLVRVTNNNTMKSQDITLEFDTAGNAFADGPWVVAADLPNVIAHMKQPAHYEPALICY